MVQGLMNPISDSPQASQPIGLPTLEEAREIRRNQPVRSPEEMEAQADRLKAERQEAMRDAGLTR